MFSYDNFEAIIHLVDCRVYTGYWKVATSRHTFGDKHYTQCVITGSRLSNLWL